MPDTRVQPSAGPMTGSAKPTDAAALFRVRAIPRTQFTVQPLGVGEDVDNLGAYVLDLVRKTLRRGFADFLQIGFSSRQVFSWQQV